MCFNGTGIWGGETSKITPMFLPEVVNGTHESSIMDLRSGITFTQRIF